MTVYQISQNVDKYYKKLSYKQRTWSFVGIVALVLALLLSIGAIIFLNWRNRQTIAQYEELLGKSHQNYYLQSIANSNLEKKLQDMSLRLAELKNNTIELERMFNELSEEKVSLEEIRAQMELGIRRTKSQLDNMQSSVNSLINQRTKTIIYTEDEICREKMDTHGK